MLKMVLSRKLKKEETSQVVETLIMKGGSSGNEISEILKEEPEVKRVQLRVPDTKLEEIDKLVAERPGNLARHTWIMEAIEEKLKKDSKKD